MLRKFIYLINPISGVGNKAEILKIISEEHRKRNLHHEILPTNAVGDYGFLRERISKDAITDVIVCGGDGSVNKVAASLMEVDVNIGIVPMGSGNGLARTAGISHKPALALQNVFTGTPAYINGFYINENFSCMLCGIGFDAAVAHEFAKQPRRGLKTYIKVTAKKFATAKPMPFTIDFNNQLLAVDAFFISVANSNQFGNNFKIAPQASLTDNLLDIVIVKGMSKFILPFSILWQITGVNAMEVFNNLPQKKNIIYFQSPTLQILNPGGAMLHIDGDPVETAEKFEIRLISKAFKLIMPPPKRGAGTPGR